MPSLLSATTSRKTSLTPCRQPGRHSQPLAGPGPSRPVLSSAPIRPGICGGWMNGQDVVGVVSGRVCARGAGTGSEGPGECLLNACRIWGLRPWARALSSARLSPGCPQNRFGVNCEHMCSCRNGGLCHAASGSCSCGLGWTGLHCELGECLSGAAWGPHRRVSCRGGTCRGARPCPVWWWQGGGP